MGKPYMSDEKYAQLENWTDEDKAAFRAAMGEERYNNLGIAMQCPQLTIFEVLRVFDFAHRGAETGDWRKFDGFFKRNKDWMINGL